MRWYRNRTPLCSALVFHLCVFLPCDLISWILTTVTRDNYQSLVTVIVISMVSSTLAWNRKVCDLIHRRHHLFCFCKTINLYGDMAMLDLLLQFYSCYHRLNYLKEMQVLIFFKIRCYSHFLSIHNPTYKTSRAWFIKIDLW